MTKFSYYLVDYFLALAQFVLGLLVLFTPTVFVAVGIYLAVRGFR